MTRTPKLLTALFLTLAASAALAVHPQSFTHNKESDFTSGQFDNTVLNNYGELALGRALTPIPLPGQPDPKTKPDAKAPAPDNQIQAILAVTQSKDGTIYFATAPKGTVYKLSAGKVSEFFTPADAFPDIAALAIDSAGDLLVGATGDSSELLKISPAKPNDKPVVLWSDADTSYIWNITPVPDGSLYLGTGPAGKLLKISPQGQAQTILDSGAQHIMSLAIDSKNRLVVGTASPGIVFRIDPAQNNKPFVLLDAGKSDVNALVAAPDGNVYALTGIPNSDESPNPADIPAKPGKPEPNMDHPDIHPTPDPMKKNISFPINLKSPSENPRTPPAFPIQAQSVPKALPKELADFLNKQSHADSNAKSPDTKPALTKPGKPSESPSPPHHHADAETDTGNTLYQISPDGAVQTLECFDDLVVTLAYLKDELLIGEASTGKLHSYNLSDKSQSLVARLQQEGITALFPAADGSLLIGTTNLGALYSMSPNLAVTGSYISDVLDAKASADFGAAKILATLPPGAQATLATRSGNIQDVANHEKFWSDWSAEIPANTSAPITSPAARFLQYRITLTRDARNAGAAPAPESPVIQQVRTVYQIPNVAPKLKNLQIDTPTVESADADEGDANDKTVDISWDATDDNQDTLVYYIYYRETSTAPWLLVARDVKDPHYTWHTKAIADGNYQIKIIASDSPDNPAETAQTTAIQSAPFIIDNTPPTIAELDAKIEGAKAVITGLAKDSTSAIVQVRFQIDAEEDWHPAAASDKIFDSPSEGFTATTRTLAAGNHRITVRATDSQGNTGYRAITVLVK